MQNRVHPPLGTGLPRARARGPAGLGLIFAAALAVLALTAAAPRAAGPDCDDALQRLAEVRGSWRGSAPATAAGDIFFGRPASEPGLEAVASALARRGLQPGPADLEAEMQRLLRDSRAPGRLAELLAALGDDHGLALECLARPLLVRRRARQAYRTDTAFHAPGRAALASHLAGRTAVPRAGGRDRSDGQEVERRLVEWLRAGAEHGPALEAAPDGLRERLAPAAWDARMGRLAAAFGITASGPGPAAMPRDRFSAIQETADAYLAWRVLERSSDRVLVEVARQPRDSFAAWVAAGPEAPGPDASDAASPEPGAPVAATESSLVPAPEVSCVDDTWTATAVDAQTPSAREWHTAVWTGAEMIVWGGRASTVPLDSGAAYDPALDAWATLPAAGAPTARFKHTAVWSGDVMIVWGGYGAGFRADGAAYDPATGTWAPLSVAGSPPTARAYHTAVWTGTQMLVWGGYDGVYLADGAAYDLLGGTWAALPTAGQPAGPRDLHTAVWADGEMIVWGGYDGNEVGDGARLDLAGGTWSALPASPLAPRRDHTAVWTGDRMIVWGGVDNVLYTDGAVYSPAGDAWSDLASPGAILSPRHWHTATWTDTEMIVWGGVGGEQDGGRYHAARQTWQATGVAAATPEPRRDHTTVWTGDQMIVWGGGSTTPGGPLLDSGGAYCAGCSLLDWHPDGDGDTFGDAATTSTACTGPSGWILDGSDCDDLAATVYPGAPGVCDGLNNDCLHPSWPDLTGTEEFDNDGDGFSSCDGDCVDDDPSVWGIPGEARLLQVAGDLRTLSWSEPLLPRASLPAYDMLRSPAGSAWDAGSASCLVTDAATGRTADDPDDPGPGGILFYLVRSGTVCGEGPVGGDSAGTPRAGRACP